MEIKHTITTKIILRFLFAALVIGAASQYLTNRAINSVKSDHLKEKVEVALKLTQAFFVTVTSYDQHERAEQLVSDIRQILNADSVGILENNQLVAHSGEPINLDSSENLQRESDTHGSIYFNEEGNRLQAVVDLPALSNHSLLIYMSDARNFHLDLLGRQVQLLSMLLLVSLTFLNMILIYRVVIRHLRRFVSVTRRIAEGDYSTRLVQKGNDELTEFATHFNQMMDEIKKRSDQINESHTVLKESELKFRSITDAAFDPIIMVDEDGDISYWNPAARKVFGYHWQDVIGRPVKDVLAPPDHQENYRDMSTEILKQEETQKSEKQKHWVIHIIKKDKSVIPVEATISNVNIDNHWNIVGVLRDISGRRRNESALAESKQKLELALNTMDAALWDWNVTSGAINFDPRYLDMLGFEESELDPTIDHWKLLIHPDDWEAMNETLEDVVQGKHSQFQYELRIQKKSGDWIWIRSLGEVYERDDSGRPIRVIGTHVNINKSKVAELGVKQYQDNLEQMVFDRTRKLEETQAELINKAIEAGRSQLSAMVLHNIGNAITPAKVQLEEMKNESFSKLLEYLEKCYGELNDNKANLTDFIQTQQRGKEVFKFMGDLVEKLSDRRQQQFDKIEKIDKAISYISEILALQQAYAVHETETKQQVNLNLLLEDALHMQSSALEKRHIKIIKQLTPGLPHLLISKNRLIQVIVNIIKNAYEATDENLSIDNHSISIKTFVEGEEVGFKIEDTGVGIEPDLIASIFEFGKSRKGSSGIGLYYCKVFIEKNRGRLEFTSDGKEKGATVTVRFKPGESAV